MFTIKATNRGSDTKLADLKKNGEIPAVFYGMGKESTSIAIPVVEFKKIWHKAGESSAVSIVTPKGSVDTLIHEVQRHPITGEPVHVDFLVIDMNKTITVSVPLEFTGISGAVKSGVGTLVKVLYEVEVEALPKDLPQKIVVDISKLATIEDGILVSDLVLPPNVSLVTKATEVVASIAEQKEEVETTTPVDLSAIEVEKKGKKEEEVAPAE
jgi:large subunit ribosomal protein L25